MVRLFFIPWMTIIYDSWFLSLWCTHSRRAEMNKAYYLKGLTCANCAAKFEKNIQAIPSVENAEVNFAASKIKINGEVTFEQINEAGAFDNIKVVDDQ